VSERHPATTDIAPRTRARKLSDRARKLSDLASDVLLILRLKQPKPLPRQQSLFDKDAA
jgi:hypothetical protein